MTDVLRIRRLSKTFPGQRALDEVDLTIAAGRTHALVGQNGSGKSTLIKVLAGYHQPDDGATAELGGTALTLGDARAAHLAGIRFVHQDLALVDALSAVENISVSVGFTTRRWRRIDWNADTERAAAALASLGFTDIDVTVPVGALSPAQKTAVALARALHRWEEDAHLLVLDEPTASLPGADVERLFTAIRLLKEREVAILYVSHHLDEVFEIADDVTVLRDGRRVTTERTADLDHDALIELMIGHRLERSARDSGSAGHLHGSDGTPRLEIRGVAGSTLRHLDLQVRAGEVVGVVGITGSGREAVIPLITGQRPSDRGEVFVDGRALPNYDPAAAIAAGLAFVPSDRARNGIVPLAPVSHNMTIGDVGRHWRRGRLRHDEEAGECVEWIDRLSIKTLGPTPPIASLSGGNQQKVLFARSLRLSPAVLVLDEPTSGIDVAAKDQILQLVVRAAADGAAVLVASTDTDELLQIADRILVIVGGVVARELSGAEMTLDQVERSQLQTTKADRT